MMSGIVAETPKARAKRKLEEMAPEPEPQAPPGPTPAEKAAIIISALGPEEATPLLRMFTQEQLRAFARASSTLSRIDKPLLEATVLEFLASLEDESMSVDQQRIRQILSSVLNEDEIERILEDMHESEGRTIWEKLSNSDPIDLANYLSREHPQTVAVVISRIRPERAAKAMMRFEPEFAEEVIMRMSKLSQLSPAVLESIRLSVEAEFLRNARQAKSKRKPDELIGAIFNYMSNEKRDDFLARLEANAPQLAAAVQRKMFTFNDVPKRLDRASVSVIIREIDNAILVPALAAARKTAPETAEFFFSNISRRLADQLKEAMDEAPDPTAREGDEAQFAVVSEIRALAEKGVFKLMQPEEEELGDEGF